MFGRKSMTMPGPDDALPGRDEAMVVTGSHHVLGTPLTPPWPEGSRLALFGMGCFWGAEKFLWQVPGVYSTFVGYGGGYTRNPVYEEVCSGRTGHNELAVVVYDPAEVPYETLLKVFWENHDPTTPNRQGNDVGTQYRSGIYPTTDDQFAEAERSREAYQRALRDGGYGDIVTEIVAAHEAGDGAFYYAESYHQQYLAKNPGGYCNHGFCQARYDLADHGQAGTGAG